MADVPVIDWSNHDKYSEDTVTCICDVTYRSHSKFVMSCDEPGIYSRRPCPSCGSHKLKRSAGDSELQTL